MRARHLLLLFSLAGCGPAAAPVEQATRPPPSDPLFPEGYAGWSKAAEDVRDELNNEVRRHFRSPAARPGADGAYPDGSVLVKTHHDARDERVVTRIDVRRRSAGGRYEGWDYYTFDPATRRQRTIDPETCHLCHAAAPADGTYAEFR